MRRAFAVKPELIYFLSDGDYTAMEQDLLSELRRLNAKKETRITVIGFAPFLAPRELLKKIAEEHGGHCRLVELK
jgi:hypothetical protein